MPHTMRSWIVVVRFSLLYLFAKIALGLPLTTNPLTKSVHQPQRIDVHHHYIPDFYNEALLASGGDPTNFGNPNWSLPLDDQFNQNNSITAVIFSITTPGTSIMPSNQAAIISRKVNEYGATLRDRNPEKYGFFATLPSLLDKNMTIKEITYALDVLHADGVAIYTSYGNGTHYLGHPDFRDIWTALNIRNATVFIHPAYGCSLKSVSATVNLSVSTMDFPQETTRTIVDMIVSNIIRDFRNVRIIVSHAGGTLPYIFGRIVNSFYQSGRVTKTPQQFLEEVKTLYFDIATSKYDITLDSITRFAAPEKILFGTDFPYNPLGAALEETKNWDNYVKMKGSPRNLLLINGDNALALFPRFRNDSVPSATLGAPIKIKPFAASWQKPQRIDVHHHFTPDFSNEDSRNGGYPTNTGNPAWSLQLDDQFNQNNSITNVIFTAIVPATGNMSSNQTARIIRKVNEHSSYLRDTNPRKYGFFAALPSLLDKNGTLEEVAYALDVLHADGFIVYTSYGNATHYLGHPDFKDVWAALNARSATVFIHPTYGCSSKSVSAIVNLTVSMMDFPQETTRTIVDMVASNVIRDFPNVKIIVSHAGGTLPYVFGRIFTSFYQSAQITKTPQQVLEEVRSIYFDIATSKYDLTLDAIMKFAAPERILFGTDFPYNPQGAAEETRNWNDYVKKNESPGNLLAVNSKNALALFPRFRQYNTAAT
ncbi:uncharacterized protein LOC129589839 [Paramacrobiotus metropolitanus]|uniref:uncharacterized protein LOC129589839 n=1 Tax=Paramacrobiotus metropolitanus TaxID=2943436 RepID=UPI0024457772|nr:uncharacterized protein LOC129589839 [Paramacrobiotus metropolitanus]